MRTTRVASASASARTSRTSARSPSAASSGRSAADLLFGRAALQGQQDTARGPAAGGTNASRRASGATARETTTSYVSGGPRPGRGRPGRGRRAPSSSTTAVRKVARRSSGSSRVTRRSGRAQGQRDARQPGAGADVDDVEPVGTRSASAGLLKTCRSQSRSPRAGRSGPTNAAVQQIDVAAERRPGSKTASTQAAGAGRTGGGSGRRAARRRGAGAPRPRTRWSGRRPPPRRARSCARTGSSAASGTCSPELLASSMASAASAASSLRRRLAVAGDVEHQPAAVAGLGHHGQPGQLLQRVEHLAVWPRPAPGTR